MGDARPLLDALDEAGYRLTAPRKSVAGLIADRSGHFSAAELLVDARRAGVGRATVFRFLDLLVELGLVERLDLPNGEHAYVPCEPSHHHHVVCSHCGRSTEVDDAGMRAVTVEIARRTGYLIDSHRVELYGLCPDCQEGGRA